MTKKNSVIILHDIDGRIYFKAISNLVVSGDIHEVIYRETNVFKKIIGSFLKRKDIKINFQRFINNFLFRIQVPFLKNKIIVLGMAPYSILFLWYGLLARNNKVIYHTSWPYWWGGDVPHKNVLIRNFLKFLFKYYLNNFNFSIVCINEPTKKSISSQLVNKNIVVIPHSVNISFFDQKTATTNNSRIRVLFVGRLVKQKGINELLDVAVQLKDTHDFTFIGSGDEENKIKKMSELNDNIKYLGYIKEKDILVKEFYNNDVFVLPSKKINGWEELFGLVIIEAMAAGLIVISTNHIGPRGIISDGDNGILISEENLNLSLKKELLAVDLNEEKYINIMCNAKRTIRDFDITNVEKKWLDVIG